MSCSHGRWGKCEMCDELDGIYMDNIATVNDLLQQIEGYKEYQRDQQRLVRELDVLINGVDGAATQASLCDIVCQLKSMKNKGMDIKTMVQFDRDTILDCLTRNGLLGTHGTLGKDEDDLRVLIVNTCISNLCN